MFRKSRTATELFATVPLTGTCLSAWTKYCEPQPSPPISRIHNTSNGLGVASTSSEGIGGNYLNSDNSTVLVTDDFYTLCDKSVHKRNLKQRKNWLKNKLTKLGGVCDITEDGVLANVDDLTRVVLRYGSESALSVAVHRFRFNSSRLKLIDGIESVRQARDDTYHPSSWFV